MWLCKKKKRKKLPRGTFGFWDLIWGEEINNLSSSDKSGELFPEKRNHVITRDVGKTEYLEYESEMEVEEENQETNCSSHRTRRKVNLLFIFLSWAPLGRFSL